MLRQLLPGAIAILALADGVLHLMLDVVLFRGGFFRNTLSVLFLLNAIGFGVLAVAFLVGRRWLGERRWLLDVVLLGYAVATLVAWVWWGAPNPRGLGYASKAIEIVLIVALVAHLAALRRANNPAVADVSR